MQQLVFSLCLLGVCLCFLRYQKKYKYTNIQPEIVHSHKFSHNILIFGEGGGGGLYFATGFVLLSIVGLIFVSKGPSTVLNFKSHLTKKSVVSSSETFSNKPQRYTSWSALLYSFLARTSLVWTGFIYREIIAKYRYLIVESQ